MKMLLGKYTNLTIFIFLLLILLVIHQPFVKILSQLDFSHDDWILTTHFKNLGLHPYQEFYTYYKYRSAYFAYQTFYIGSMETIFGLNPPSISYFNLVIKILSALSIYPLILILFRKKLLAFLTALLVAFNYNSFATLEYPMKGADYFGILFMIWFLALYGYSIMNHLKALKWMLSLTALFLLALFFSPARTYPLLVIPLLTEIFYLIKVRSKEYLSTSFKRLLAVYLPILIVFLKDPPQYWYVLTHIPGVFNKLAQGKLDHILVPFSGIGLSLFPQSFWGDFGFNLITHKTLITILLYPLLPVAGPLTYIILWSVLKKPFKATLIILIANLILVPFFYSILEASGDTPISLEHFYPYLIGGYCLTLAIYFLVKWLLEKNAKQHYLALALGPLFSLVFVLLTWVLADRNLTFTGIHYYLNIVSIGSSLFIAVIIYHIFFKINIKTNNLHHLALIFLFLIIFSLFITNSFTAQNYFISQLEEGRSIDENNQLKQQMQFYLNKYQITDLSKPVLFIFDETGETQSNKTVYANGLIVYFIYWMHIQNNILRPGCVGNLPAAIDQKSIEKLIVEKDGKKYLSYYGLCLKPQDKLNVVLEQVLYKPEEVYFFQLKNKKIIDVQSEWQKKLNLLSS